MKSERDLDRHPGVPVQCPKHGQQKSWIGCLHVREGDVPATCERFESGPFGGEVLCAACFALMEAEPDEVDGTKLLLTCEACVLDRFRITDAS
jgi:hypothetical protein